jgi:hypothetical protein
MKWESNKSIRLKSKICLQLCKTDMVMMWTSIGFGKILLGIRKLHPQSGYYELKQRT